LGLTFLDISRTFLGHTSTQSPQPLHRTSSILCFKAILQKFLSPPLFPITPEGVVRSDDADFENEPIPVCITSLKKRY
jgi:hypothetical protein